MAYLEEEDENLYKDIISRKEFAMLKNTIKENVDDNPFVKRFDSEKYIPKNRYTFLKSYQVFVGNFFNPNTPYTRLLMKWETGVGKTSGSMAIAYNFLNMFREINENVEFTGSVFILGFTEEIFKRELLKFPEFGFVDAKEIKTLNTLRHQMFQQNSFAEEQYKELLAKFKRRLTNRKGNGLFKFYGYKAVANRLFITKKNIVDMERDEIIKEINSGEIKLNGAFLDEFANSLIICDEMHNLYNSVKKNNWGISIETILNYNKSCRALFLSATPINSSPTEVVDLLNLLLPRDKYPLVYVHDFFKNNELIPGALERIKSYFRGRVSFVRDVNQERYPTREIDGERIPGICFLRFNRCVMSDFHRKTYEKVYSGSIPIEGIYLTDICLPDPDEKNPYEKQGLYISREIRQKYTIASHEWKVKYMLSVENDEITGEALSEKNYLETISSKYYHMLKKIKKVLCTDGGKTFIYHNSKQISGVFFIREVLLQNGFIMHDENPSDCTLCSSCGKPRKDHSKDSFRETRGGSAQEWYYSLNYVKQNDDEQTEIRTNDTEAIKRLVSEGFEIIKDDSLAEETVLVKKTKRGGTTSHIYTPARIVVLHGDMPKKDVDFLMERFNSADNTEGNKICCLIGSRFMAQSYTLMAIQHLYVMSRPDDISMLLQIIGRGVRDGTHLLLPPEKRHVKISIFVSSLKKELSYEEIKYKEKIELYTVIRKIEKCINESAIDKFINYNMIMQKQKSVGEYELEIEKYDRETFTPKKIDTNTFNVYYAKQEIKYLEYMIKRLFMETSSVWTYDDLLAAVKNPPFSCSIDVKLIAQDHFNIALDNLVYKPNADFYRPFFLDEELIVVKDKTYIIGHFGQYYIILLMNQNTHEIFVDIESWSRTANTNENSTISVKEYIESDSKNYLNKKERFIMIWFSVDLRNLSGAIHMFGIEFHIRFIEDTIEYLYKYYIKGKKDKNLDFYIKIEEYYSIFGLILYASDVKPPFDKPYKGLFSKTKEKEQLPEESYISKRIEKSNPEWISTGMVKSYENKKKYKGKPLAQYVPVGHFLGNIPRIYDGAWKTVPEYRNLDIEYIENNIIVGYEEKSDEYIDIKFKIRSPIQNIKKFNDMRLIEKGSICRTKSREFLLNLCKKLNIKIDTKNNTETICEKIKNEIMYREIKERQKKSKIKWFYNFFENRPEII